MTKLLFGKSALTIMSVFALAITFTVSAPVTSAEAASCKSNVVSRLVKARFKSLGKQRARTNWRRKARSRYGWKYRKWSKAKSKGYHITVHGHKFLLYHIRAYGTPCK